MTENVRTPHILLDKGRYSLLDVARFLTPYIHVTKRHPDTKYKQSS